MFEENTEDIYINFPKCDKCIIVSDDILNYFMKEVIIEQRSIYCLIDLYNYSEFVYTNNYNIVIDALMRLINKFEQFIETITKRCRVEHIIIFDNSTGRINITTKEMYAKLDNKERVVIPTSKALAGRIGMQISLMKALKNWSTFLNCDEEEDYEPVETYLVKQIPKYYSFSIRDMMTWYKTHSTDIGYREKRFKAKIDFINAVCVLQSRLTYKEIDAIKELFMHNLKRNNDKRIKIIKSNYEINYDMLFSLFYDEKILYCCNYCVKRRNMFFYYKGEFTYPYMNATNKKTLFTPIDLSTTEIMRRLKIA